MDPCPHRRLLDTHKLVWLSLSWGHCSFLLVPGAHKVCLCPPRVCFPVLCKFWQLYGGLMATSSKSAYAIPKSVAPRAPVPVADHCQPVSPQGTLKHSSVSVSVGSLGPGIHKVCLSPLHISGRNTNSPFLPFCWNFSFALGNVSFSGGIQHSPVNSCSAASCNFGVLAGENECTSCYSAMCHFVSYSVLVMSISVGEDS